MEEASTTLGTPQRRVSSRFRGREGIYDDVFDPIRMVT